MKSDEQWEQTLKQALASSAEPGEELNLRLINRMKERNTMKPLRKKRLSTAVIAAAITLTLSATAFAATQMLSPKQMAEHIGDRALAKAFASEGALELNQSAVSDGYRFTLHGIVSGQGLSDFARKDAQGIKSDRTYAVVSIARTDGKPMPSTRDADYNKTPFFVSPLVKGEKPWLVNIFTMQGVYHEEVLDGIQYRLIECDGVEMFADKGLYLAVSTGGFFDKKAFSYDEKTGAIGLNPEFKGAHALFDLPIDPAKADPAKAKAYLQGLFKEPAEAKSETPSPGAEATPAAADGKSAAPAAPNEEWRKDLAKGKVIPESVKVAAVDKDGMVNYEYAEYGEITILASALFKEGQVGDSDFMHVSGSPEDGNYSAIRFSRDANGVISGKVILFHSEHSIVPAK